MAPLTVAPTTRFVGRTDELAALAATLDRARTGRGSVVTVVGDPGAGKTALVEQALAGDPANAVWTRAREGGGAPPLWSWHQLWRRAGAHEPEAAEPATVSGDRGSQAGTGVDRFSRFDVMARTIVEAHQRAPLTIVLDDLQWADSESLAFLEFFGPDAIEHGIVVLATVRRGELDRLPRSGLVVELGGLDRAAVGVLMDSHDDALVDAVCEHTGGNPFFIVEVERLLRARDRPAGDDQWRTVVPEGVRAVLSRRFARLSQRSHRTLIAAAELGEEIDPTLLAAALDADRDEVVDELAPAVGAGMLRPLADGRFAFGHSLVREAARAEVPLAQRRQLNERAADLLASMRGERAAGQIALHLLAADEPGRALAWAVSAGEAAYASAMYSDAAAWFGRALAVAAEAQPTIQLRFAEALARCGRGDDAESQFWAVARTARAEFDAGMLGRAALGVGSIGGGFEVRLLDAAQQSLLADAIGRLDGQDSVLLALLLARRSVAISLDADHDERAALAEEAVAMATRLGDDVALGYALGAWCDAFAGPADIDRRAAAATQMVVVAVRAGDIELELLGRRLAMVAALEAGEIGVVRRHVEAFVKVADRLRLPEFCWYGRLMEAMLAHVAGQLDDASRLVQQASELGRRANSANARMLADGALWPVIDRDRGDPSFAARIAEVNSQIPEATRGFDVATAMQLYTIGFEPSRPLIEAAVPVAVELQRATSSHDGLSLLMAWLVGNGAAFLGEDDLVAASERALAPYESRFVLDGTGSVCHEPVAAVLARLATAAGDHELAAARFENAIVAARRIGAPLIRERLEREAQEAARAAPREARPPLERTGRLRREGDTWQVIFDGGECRLKHSKGLGDLAVLLARPDQDVHVFDLVAASDGAAVDTAGRRAAPDRSDGGPVIDMAAKRSYEERIRTLTEEIEGADRSGDDDRAARLDDERAVLLSHLASALGIGGRPRVANSDVERARKAVGMRIRDAVRRIDESLPGLGRHLRHTVHTGTTCSYRPEIPIDWII